MVPFLDLKTQYKKIKVDVEKAILEVCASQKFILGETVQSFEKNFAQYCGTDFAVGVASGTDALILALRALDIGPGDEVITSPFSFIATSGAISLVGAKPVFVDVDPKTFNIDPLLIEKKLSEKTKAILPVHLFGLCAEMQPILEIAKNHKIAIVEDACQAVGAAIHDQKAGSFGSLGCFSFFPSKNLGGFGDGGMITTNDLALANKLKMLREHGSQQRYLSEIMGTNSRLDALQAIILDIKLNVLNKWNQKRAKKAQFYQEALKDLPLQLPCVAETSISVYNQYTIQVENREGLIEFLKEKEIGYSIYYPIPLHLQPCNQSYGYKEGDFPIAESLSKKVLSLPIFPELTQEQQEEVVDVLRCFSPIT